LIDRESWPRWDGISWFRRAPRQTSRRRTIAVSGAVATAWLRVSDAPYRYLLLLMLAVQCNFIWLGIHGIYTVSGFSKFVAGSFMSGSAQTGENSLGGKML
jgi:hypothetical protein